MNSIHRRQLLAGSVSGLGVLAVSPLLAALAEQKTKEYRSRSARAIGRSATRRNRKPLP